MNLYGFSMPESRQTSWLLPLGIVAVAIFCGMATAVVAGRAGFKAVYYAVVFGLLGLGFLVALTREEPLRLGWFALLLFFPIANAAVPPGRFGWTIFNAVTIAIAIVLIFSRALRTRRSGPLFPGRSTALAWLCSIPVLVFSMAPGTSAKVMAANAGAYAFFLMALGEMQRERGFERVVGVLAFVMLVIDAGLLIDHLFQVNLSMRGSNLNQVSSVGGMQIYRAGGFFQDPQAAGAFLSCATTFLLLLLVRGRFAGTRVRYLVTAAVLASLAGLMLTISRGAIISCVLISMTFLFLFNRWSAPVKIIAGCGLLLLAAGLAITPPDTLLQMMPRAVASRFEGLGESLDTRIMIWFDTWDMFADNPLTGIGMGTFRDYLLETRPGVVNYYGIGLEAGVPYIPVQAESGYLTILYEGGLLGALGALLVGGDGVRRALSVIRANPQGSAARTEGIAALGAMLSFAITFVSLFTWMDTRVAGLYMLLLAVVWARSLQVEAGAAR